MGGISAPASISSGTLPVFGGNPNSVLYENVAQILSTDVVFQFDDALNHLEISANNSELSLGTSTRTAVAGYCGLNVQGASGGYVAFRNSAGTQTGLIYNNFTDLFIAGRGTANIIFQNGLATAGSLVNVTGDWWFGASDPGGAGKVRINGALTVNSATMIESKTAFSNGAAAAVGTLANAPFAGNPSKWIPVNDNGTTRYIPAW